jgi:spore cortex formation protein SpoVR/YcgB (stage V sporulation)
MLLDNEEFYNDIRNSIVNKIKQVEEPKIELADVEN